MTTSSILPRDYTLSVRLTDDVRQQLEKVAQATGKTKTFFALEALRDRLEYELWDLEQTQAAIAEADADEFATNADMRALFAKYGS